ncbi:hypothetical protein GCM10027046_26460 [Uliginosibacterium flavum]
MCHAQNGTRGMIIASDKSAMYFRGIGTANPPKRYTKVECLKAFEASAWSERLNSRTRFIMRTVLHNDNGIDARRLAVDSI